MPKEDSEETVNIFDLLSKETEKNETKSRRAELLEPMGIEDRFKEGTISINMRTCRGIECNLCVKACPTNALYWKVGKIGIIEDLCVHCTACVTNCMVDDCIKVTRKRPDGQIESFSNVDQVCNIQRKIGTKKRKERVESLYPTQKEYFDSHTNK